MASLTGTGGTIYYGKAPGTSWSLLINEDMEPSTVTYSREYTIKKPTKPAPNMPMQPNRRERRRMKSIAKNDAKRRRRYLERLQTQLARTNIFVHDIHAMS